MAPTYRDPQTGVLYPSKEFATAEKTVKARGGTATTTAINREMGKSNVELQKTGGQTVDPIIQPTTPLVVNQQAGQVTGIAQARSRDEFYKARIDDLEKREEERRKEEADRRKAFEAERKEKKSTLDKVLSRGEQREKEFEEIGVDEKQYFTEQKAAIAEVGALMADYDALAARKDTRIAEIESMAMIESAQTTEKIKAEKQFNIELSQKASQINTKLAIQEMENNNFEQARDFVNTAIDDYEFELKLELEEYQSFLDENEAAFEELDEEERDIINETWAIKQAEFAAVDENEQANGDAIKAGYTTVKIGDTKEERFKKMAETTLPGDLKTEIIESGGKQLLINSQTGEIIKDFGVTTVLEGTITDDEGNIITAEQAKADDVLNQITNIEDHRGFEGSVGFGLQKLPFLTKLGLTPGRVAFEAEVDRLKALISLESMAAFKGQGQISDAERKIISDVGTSLNTGMSEKDFKKELGRLRNVFNKVRGRVETGTTGTTISTGQTSSGINYKVIE